MHRRRPSGCLFVSGALLFAALPVAADGCAPAVPGTSAIVRSVHDGDTFSLDDGTRVRLVGVDTPELAREGQPAQPYAHEARRLLGRLLPSGTAVAVVRDPEPRDRYGRTLAHAVLADGTTAQSHLLSAGLAVAIIIPPNDTLAACYRSLEAQARAAGKGLWSRPERGPLSAGQVRRDTRGYRLVQGEVKSVARDGSGVRLRLEGRLTVRIGTADASRFPRGFLDGLRGRQVLARGWIAHAGRGLSMRVRHELDLQILPARTQGAARKSLSTQSVDKSVDRVGSSADSRGKHQRIADVTKFDRSMNHHSDHRVIDIAPSQIGVPRGSSLPNRWLRGGVNNAGRGTLPGDPRSHAHVRMNVPATPLPRRACSTHPVSPTG